MSARPYARPGSAPRVPDTGVPRSTTPHGHLFGKKHPTTHTNILFDLGAPLLLPAGALVLATRDSAFACEVRCYEVCPLDADRSFGCGPITSSRT